MKPERFRWEATDRTTGMIYREDVNGLGSFAHLDATRLSDVSLYTPMQGGEAGIHLAIPKGATAVFVRRRVLTLQPDRPSQYQLQYQPGYTIIGYRWPDDTGVYHFFDEAGNTFMSSDFNAV